MEVPEYYSQISHPSFSLKFLTRLCDPDTLCDFKLQQFSNQEFMETLPIDCRLSLTQRDMILYSHIILYLQVYAYDQRFSDNFIRALIITSYRMFPILIGQKDDFAKIIRQIFTELCEQKVPKRDVKRYICDSVAILFYCTKMRIPVMDSMSRDSFVIKYDREIKDALRCRGIEQSDIDMLHIYRNVMKVFSEFYYANANMSNILTIITKLTEGYTSRYVTGGGQTIQTTLRCHIYRTETETSMRTAPKPMLRENGIVPFIEPSWFLSHDINMVPLSVDSTTDSIAVSSNSTVNTESDEISSRDYISKSFKNRIDKIHKSKPNSAVRSMNKFMMSPQIQNFMNRCSLQRDDFLARVRSSSGENPEASQVIYEETRYTQDRDGTGVYQENTVTEKDGTIEVANILCSLQSLDRE